MGPTPKLIPGQQPDYVAAESAGVLQNPLHEPAGNSDFSFPRVHPVWDKAAAFAQARPFTVADASNTLRAEDQQCRYDAETFYEPGSHRDPDKLLPNARVYLKHKGNQPKGGAAPVTAEVTAACLEGDKGVRIPFPSDIHVTTEWIGDAEIDGVMQQDVNEATAHFTDRSGKTLEFKSRGLGRPGAIRNLRLFMMDTFFNSMVPAINETRRNQRGGG